MTASPRARLAPGETVSCFRQRMIASTVQRGDWNYFGTHVCALEQGRVTGGSPAPGHGDVHDDPLVDSPVELVGKLVDIDPTGFARRSSSTSSYSESRVAPICARGNGGGAPSGLVVFALVIAIAASLWMLGRPRQGAGTSGP